MITITDQLIDESGFMRKVAGQLEVFCQVYYGEDLHDVCLHSEALAGYAARDARIDELEDELSDIDFARRVSLQNENDMAETLKQLRAELDSMLGQRNKVAENLRFERELHKDTLDELDRSRACLSRVDAENSALNAELAAAGSELEQTLIDWGTLRLEVAALKAAPAVVMP
jgi:chromosome segregation ATPase